VTETGVGGVYLHGDLSSLPYKTVRYVLSSLRVINKFVECRTRPRGFMQIRINANRRGFGVRPPDS